MNRVLHDEAYHREYYGVRLDGPRESGGPARPEARRQAGTRAPRAGQVRDHPGRASRPRQGASRTGGRADRLSRSPRVSRGRRLFRVALPGEASPRPHQRQLRRRPLRDRLRRTGDERPPARGHLLGPGFAGVLLLPGDGAPRHEGRGTRVQGHGAGAVCVAASRRGCGRRAAPGVRPGRGHPGPLCLEEARAALSAAPGEHARPALRRHCRGRPADRRGIASGVGPAHAGAPRRRVPRARRRRVHERQGQHAARRRGLGPRSLRVSVLRGRVERRGRGVSRIPADGAKAGAWRRRSGRSGPATSARPSPRRRPRR